MFNNIRDLYERIDRTYDNRKSELNNVETPCLQ